MPPALFLSHGAPTLALDDDATAVFLAELGRRLPRPRAIVCASAHWLTASPAVGGATAPATIHDFGGFDPALSRLAYPAPGDPALAGRVAALLADAGLPAMVDARRGLDHGVWVPLARMFPAADIPVVPLALQPRRGAAHHLALGGALAPLRAEGVLVIGSGGASHNLMELGAGEAPAWMSAFDAWLAETIARGDVDALLDWRRAPHAARNHPTDEHLLPLFVALGAGGAGPGARVHAATTYGALSMACFAWE